MIYAFTGKTGSGKTFQMVKQAYGQWLHGTDIYSNTILLFENKKRKAGQPRPSLSYWFKKNVLGKKDIERPTYGKIQYFEDITELLEIKNGIILIDEAQVLLNARNWEALPYEFQYKLQQHRKHRLDLYCTTQNMGTIDITYRRLVQHWYHCRDVFAFLFMRNPSLLTFHVKEIKDVDYLYNSVDDLQVPNLKRRYFTIHKLKKRLYDTMFDIGFKRFKVIWLSSREIGKKKTEKIWIIPKQMSLKDAQRLSSSYNLALGLSRSRTLRKT